MSKQSENMVTFYTTFPNGMPTEDIEDVIRDTIRHGVRDVDYRHPKGTKFLQAFIHCTMERSDVRILLREIKSDNGRHRVDYDLGGRTRGYILISEYRPKEKTVSRPKRNATANEDLRSEVHAMMRITRDLEKEIARLQRENGDLRNRLAATTELPRLSMPVPTSPGYYPTSPKTEDHDATTPKTETATTTETAPRDE